MPSSNSTRILSLGSDKRSGIPASSGCWLGPDGLVRYFREERASGKRKGSHLATLLARVADSRARVSPELTVVVPCYNERPNVAPLVERLDAALVGIAWEVVFVDDDSPDGTAA